MINQYYCIIFLQNEYRLISFFLSPSLFSEHLIRHYKVDFKNLLFFHDYLLRSNFHGNLFWHRKILSSYFLLLNLSRIVRFSQNMTVLQLAVISLFFSLLLSVKLYPMMLIVSSFIILSRTLNALICPLTKVFFQ